MTREQYETERRRRMAREKGKKPRRLRRHGREMSRLSRALKFVEQVSCRSDGED